LGRTSGSAEPILMLIEPIFHVAPPQLFPRSVPRRLRYFAGRELLVHPYKYEGRSLHLTQHQPRESLEPHSEGKALPILCLGNRERVRGCSIGVPGCRHSHPNLYLYGCWLPSELSTLVFVISSYSIILSCMNSLVPLQS
jgi:hypothetical protein